MSIDERARHHLHSAVEQVLGAEQAATLMELLPPTGWADVATKADFAAQRAVFTAEMDGLRTELRADIRELRTELRDELHTETGALRTEIGALHTTLEARLADTTRTILLAVMALMITTWGAMAGIVLTR